MTRRSLYLLCFAHVLVFISTAAHAQAQETVVLKNGGEGPGFTAVLFSGDGKTLITGEPIVKGFSWLGKVKLWDAAAWKEKNSLTLESTFASMALSSDGTRLATSGSDVTNPGRIRNQEGGPFQVWDLATQKRLIFSGQLGPTNCVTFAPDGKTLAFGGYHGPKLFHLAKEKEIVQFEKPLVTANALAFSPDGKLLAVGGYKKERGAGENPPGDAIQLFDPATGKSEGTLDAAWWVTALAFSRDGKTLAAGGGREKLPELKLWDVASRKARFSLKGHTDTITSLALSPNGKTLASAGRDGTIRLWDMDAGKERALLRGHIGVVHSVAFHPDGAMLASAGEDRTVRIWDVSSPK